jgi:3'(2'), 5'-bisphosphate nucleotidase
MTLNITIGLAEQIGDIAKRAGEVIMKVYTSDFNVAAKGDKSPVTEADTKAENLIFCEIRTKIGNDIPLVGEESVAAGKMPKIDDKPFWLIDPLDGTKEFINKNGEFTVNIALIEHGMPVLGAVHLPVTQDTFIATRAGVFVQYGGEGHATQIACRQAPASGLVAIASKSHNTPETEAYLDGLNIKERTSAGSSLKFCRIAEGKADVYPRFGPTMEWDTAAAHAVLMFAGGEVITEDGRPLSYGKPGLKNPFFIARGPGVPDPTPT